MGETVEYETPISCMKRLTQKDNSDNFDIIIKFSKEGSNENKIRTTLNKARVISNKINEIYQIDPTITQYELIVPIFLNKSNNLNSEESLRTVTSNIEMILKSTTDKITITKNEKQQINIILRLLGEINNDNEDSITINSINEAISYLSTEFHLESVRYLSKHINNIIDENQIFKLDKEIIKEIIDTYFNDKIENNDEEIFDKMKNNEETGIVFHFLLQIENEKYTKEMREYIINNLSDEIISEELSLIIKQFLKQMNYDTQNSKETNKKTENIINIEYQNDELKGIISFLKTKFGENLIEQGKIKINDIGNHHEVTGSLSNLIKYDNEHINQYYMNNHGTNPLPNSNEGWIEFDFIDKKINLTSYTLRYSNGNDYFPKSWRIVGSNDRNEWEIINQQTNNSSLNGYYKQHRFECENKHKYYQYIRYIQDDSWRSNRKYNIGLACVEFFGSILEQ